VLTGNGDVLEPEGGIAAHRFRRQHALCRPRARLYEDDPEKIARRAAQVAADICVFTNDRVALEEI
jgi:ATP-dependent HslUV protease subunit HslV